MENLNLCFTISGMVIVVIIVLWTMLRRNKDVSVTGADLGPLHMNFDDKSVASIKIISSPIAACKNEQLTPPLEVKLMGEEGNVLRNRKVILEIYDENGLISIKKLSGTLTKNTDYEGTAIFDDLVIKATGIFKLFIICDKQQGSIDDIYIFPPGLSIDFWNYTVGSPQYEERLDRILRFYKKGKDE